MSVRRPLGWAGEVLITVGALLLLFVAWQLWWTDVVANRAAAQVVDGLRDDFARAPDGQAGEDATGAVATGDAFALMYVPRLGADWVRPVVEGTGTDELSSGIGHYDGTAAPGQVGNFAVAGHRTTWGRPFHDIDTLAAGDRVVVETAAHVYVYAVTGHEIVAPDDVAVIAPVPDEPGTAASDPVLTITSCHPKYSAAQRYVVHARLEQTVDAADLDAARSGEEVG